MLKTTSHLTSQTNKPLQEKCGIVAVYNKSPRANLPLALLCAGGVQHRGQQGAGVVLKTAKKITRLIGNGHLSDIFTQAKVARLNARNKWILVHCRYGTYGGYDQRNLQPCMVKAKDGTVISVIHNGEFAAVEEMRRRLGMKLPHDISDTYIFAQLLAREKGNSWDEKIVTALSKVNGAYCLLIGIDNVIYVTRDQFGLRPLVFGQLKNNWIVASETHALDKIGAKILREVRRGEIMKLTDEGPVTIQKGKERVGNFCEFEWAYFSRPDSLLETPTDRLAVALFRRRCGELLAQESPISHATLAVGVPDSGIAVTTGFANALHIPYHQAIVRDHFDVSGDQRLFMRDDQKKLIKKKVLGKLSLVPDHRIWKNAVVVIGDDSIVRGNVSGEITHSLFALGAREVHWIVGFPPVAHPCHLGVSMRTYDELIASRHKGDVTKIAKEIGATSVRYITYRSFIKARLGNEKLKESKSLQDLFLLNSGCGGCITGQYPISREGAIHPLATK